jgi:hypothetical protein
MSEDYDQKEEEIIDEAVVLDADEPEVEEEVDVPLDDGEVAEEEEGDDMFQYMMQNNEDWAI